MKLFLLSIICMSSAFSHVFALEPITPFLIGLSEACVKKFVDACTEECQPTNPLDYEKMYECLTTCKTEKKITGCNLPDKCAWIERVLCGKKCAQFTNEKKQACFLDCRKDNAEIISAFCPTPSPTPCTVKNCDEVCANSKNVPACVKRCKAANEDCGKTASPTIDCVVLKRTCTSQCANVSDPVKKKQCFEECFRPCETKSPTKKPTQEPCVEETIKCREACAAQNVIPKDECFKQKCSKLCDTRSPTTPCQGKENVCAIECKGLPTEAAREECYYKCLGNDCPPPTPRPTIPCKDRPVKCRTACAKVVPDSLKMQCFEQCMGDDCDKTESPTLPTTGGTKSPTKDAGYCSDVEKICKKECAVSNDPEGCVKKCMDERCPPIQTKSPTESTCTFKVHLCFEKCLPLFPNQPVLLKKCVNECAGDCLPYTPSPTTVCQGKEKICLDKCNPFTLSCWYECAGTQCPPPKTPSPTPQKPFCNNAEEFCGRDCENAEKPNECKTECLIKNGCITRSPTLEDPCKEPKLECRKKCANAQDPKACFFRCLPELCRPTKAPTFSCDDTLRICKNKCDGNDNVCFYKCAAKCVDPEDIKICSLRRPACRRECGSVTNDCFKKCVGDCQEEDPCVVCENKCKKKCANSLEKTCLRTCYVNCNKEFGCNIVI